MSIFDLLFLLALVASGATLITAVVAAIRGRYPRAIRILKIYGTCAVAYLLAGLVVSYAKPQRVLSPGEPWCFDDWCLTVESVSRTPAPSQVRYNVGLRISSRAGRVTQRAKGAWVYLIDDRGRRYAPQPDASAVALDVLLRPQESVTTARVFQVPEEVQRLGLITGHGGPYCGAMSILIIGESGCLFNKPTIVRIQ